MQKAIDFLEEQLHGITPNGANSSLIDTVKVVYYGQPTPLEHLASTSQKGLRVSITPHEPIVPEIVKACLQAGFNAYQFSKDIAVVTLPMPSGETKQEMKKRIKVLAEEAKISIRNVRKKFKQGAPDKSEDKALQKITDKAISIVEDIISTKISYLD